MEIISNKVDFGEEINIILGMSHFIKTVDDLSEIIVTTVSQAKYCVVFNEASGPSLIRSNANDEELRKKAIDFMSRLGAGHSFLILLKNAYPINILNKVKMCDEVLRIFVATANPINVLSAKDDNGSAIIGVIDGFSPKGVEDENDVKKRRDFLKMIGYKY